MSGACAKPGCIEPRVTPGKIGRMHAHTREKILMTVFDVRKVDNPADP